MYRVENKYNCSGTEMYLLQQRVETVLHPDTNESNPEGYSVVSLYFDDLQDSCLQETMDDGVMTAYIHYLLVAPEYQHCGIGRRLVEIAKERYADYLKIVLIAYTHGTGFYENCGFHAAHDSVAMYLTEMGD